MAFAQGTKFQDGLKLLVDNNVPPCASASATAASETPTVVLPMAFVLGTRLTDPNAVGQQQFAPSSHYMPPFMRVNPVLDWTYGHVWHFLRLFQLPYCCLYDQGYTSLGTVKDTVPCPALAVPGVKNSSSSNSRDNLPKYWPAYMLSDWDQERAGRLSKQQVAAQSAAKSSGGSKSRLSSAKKTATTILAGGTGEIESHTGRSEAETASIGHLSTMSEGRVLKQNAGEKNDDSYEENPIPSSVSYSSDDDTQKSAALLIIGDEILKGYTADTNTQQAATALRENNVLLKCVSVVSDCQQEIVNEIRRLQKQVDVIITSGGVGPTHDDVTIKSVAAALNCSMEYHEEMALLLREKMNGTAENKEEVDAEPVQLTEAQEKMAMLPTYSKLRYLSKDPDDWPILQVKNLFILPGVPEYFKDKIVNLGEYLGCQLERSFCKVVLKVDENSIVPVLNQVVENHPSVVIGSYPFVSHPEYKTVITVEGRLVPLDRSGPGGRSNSTVFDKTLLDLRNPTNTAVQMALDELIHALPEGSVLRVESDDMNLFS